jgi:hypothetical protein
VQEWERYGGPQALAAVPNIAPQLVSKCSCALTECRHFGIMLLLLLLLLLLLWTEVQTPLLPPFATPP